MELWRRAATWDRAAGICAGPPRAVWRAAPPAAVAPRPPPCGCRPGAGRATGARFGAGPVRPRQHDARGGGGCPRRHRDPQHRRCRRAAGKEGGQAATTHVRSALTKRRRTEARSAGRHRRASWTAACGRATSSAARIATAPCCWRLQRPRRRWPGRRRTEAPRRAHPGAHRRGCSCTWARAHERSCRWRSWAVASPTWSCMSARPGAGTLTHCR